MRKSRENGNRSRRQVLLALGAAGIASLAGCKGVEYPGDSEGDEEPSPPGTAFDFAFDPDASSYTISYEGDGPFDEDNTGLLGIDHVTETVTATRKIWFAGPEFDPVVPGESTMWAYDADRVTSLEVVWAPPGSAGSGRAPEVLTQQPTT